MGRPPPRRSTDTAAAFACGGGDRGVRCVHHRPPTTTGLASTRTNGDYLHSHMFLYRDAEDSRPCDRVSFVWGCIHLLFLSFPSLPLSHSTLPHLERAEVGIARADNFLYFTRQSRHDRPQRIPSWAPKRELGIILWYRRVRLRACLFPAGAALRGEKIVWG